MNAFRSICLLLIIANIVLICWQFWRPTQTQYAKPTTDSGIPSLVLEQEYVKLERLKPRLKATACWILGPFDSEKQMRAAWQSLNYVVLDMQSYQSLLTEHIAYRVTIPPSENLLSAQQLLPKLHETGIDEVEIIRSGDAENAIFLGQFQELSDASNIQKRVQAIGLEVQLKSVQSNIQQWHIKATVLNQAGFTQWQAELTPKVPTQPCQTANPVP